MPIFRDCFGLKNSCNSSRFINFSVNGPLRYYSTQHVHLDIVCAGCAGNQVGKVEGELHKLSPDERGLG